MYKTMHLLAPTKEVMDTWTTALRRLYAVQTDLMGGLSQGEMLEAVWERHYWNGRGFTFEDIEKLCKRLNVSKTEDELRRLFQVFYFCFWSDKETKVSLSEPTQTRMTAWTLRILGDSSRSSKRGQTSR
jgi:hypothetical protein